MCIVSVKRYKQTWAISLSLCPKLCVWLGVIIVLKESVVVCLVVRRLGSGAV